MLLSLTAGFMVVFALTANSTIINIPADYPTIQQGINAAVNGDTVLVADGVYTGNINFSGKSILILSENGPEFTTIEIGNSGNPVVSFISGEGRNSILEGFTVTGDLSYWGIYCNSSSPSIIGNILTYHEAGVKVENGGPLIRRNDISFCEHVDISLNKGAGIYIDGGVGAVIDSNIIHHNIAHVAPGLVVDNNQDVVITHNLLYSNIATDYASCMGFYGVTNMNIINNTVANNIGPSNNLGALNFTSCNNVDIINNIIAFNTDWGIMNYYSSTIYGSYNDVYGNNAGNYNGVTPGPGSISLDPLFIDPISDFRLTVGSPCLDSGDPSSPLDPDGTIADMGAIYGGYSPEPGQIIYVPGDYPTIQEAINASNSGDTILVSDGVYTENINFLGKSILILSENGPEFTTIEIGISGYPVVSFISGEGRNSILEGFTVTGDLSKWGIYCNSSSPSIIGNILTYHEAGVKVENGGPLIRRNDISYCEHVDISLNKGAGIYIDWGVGAVIDSNIIHHNIAHVAPGLVVDNTQDVVMTHNLLYSNVATDYASCMGFYGNTNMEIINNSIVYNIGPDNNLGALNFTSCNNINIINSIIAFNTDWGIMNYYSSTVYGSYNDVYGNDAGNYNGITPGPGSISEDPLFVDIGNFDYHLQAGSPCIDAGDPNSPLDPDGTIADMGALYSGDI
ncbi:MAG: right-handed parallel beta-helix repeat-containing protein, partial [Promethearchaeota archaeon]